MYAEQEGSWAMKKGVSAKNAFCRQKVFVGKEKSSCGESSRNQSIMFQKVQLIDMHSAPLQHLLYTDRIVLWPAGKFVSHILWEWQLSKLSRINHKNSILDIFCILGIFLWIYTLSTVLLQRAAWTSMKTSKWKQRTSILWLGWKYMTQTKTDCLLRLWMWSSKGNETVSQLLESQWSLCGGSC